jgi:hypothetical protein
MKHVPRSQQHHDFYAKYRHQDSKISALLGECGPNIGIITAFMITIFFCGAAFWPFMLWEMVTEKRLK